MTKLFPKPKVERRSYHRTPRLPFVGAGAVTPNLSFMQLAFLRNLIHCEYPTAMQNIGGKNENVAMTLSLNPTLSQLQSYIFPLKSQHIEALIFCNI